MKTMDCGSFEDRLDEFEAEVLSSEEKEAAERHLRSCARCRNLLRIVRGDSEVRAPEWHDDLARSILARTSGPACRDAEQCLCEWIDGTLGADGQEIVSLHIKHCSDCGELAETLNELSEALPGMATLDPDVYFTADVLEATVGLRSRSRGSHSPIDVSEWWHRLIRRPRFAWEAAYVGTLFVLLALGNPALLPKALSIEQLVIQSSDRILQQTTTVFADRQEAAWQSILDLELKGQSLMGTVADFQVRTTSALRQEASTFLQELELALLDANGPDARQRDLY